MSECACGAPEWLHDEEDRREHVVVYTVSTKRDLYWCLRTTDGSYLGDDRMEPEDANLLRDMRWVVDLAEELYAERARGGK